MSPYQRGYDEAVADVAMIAYAFWTLGRLIEGTMFKSWPYRLRIVGWLLSVVAFYFAFSYVLIPGFRLVAEMFGGD
jgi:hypothetical protein